MPKTKQANPVVNWRFTVNDIDQSIDYTTLTDAPVDLYDPDHMAYMIYQVEKAPTTGNLHLQGFLVMKVKKRLTQMKKIHATAHWLVSDYPTAAARYCEKSDTHIAGPWEWGSRPDKRGKKSQTALAVEAIKSGMRMPEVAKEYPEAIVRSGKGLQQLSYLLNVSPSWRTVSTTWIYGETGRGKTRTAFESKCADGRDPYFIVLPAQWWDGYDGQDTIIFDDFYGQVKVADMLRYLDGYPLQLPVKGSFVWANWTRVFITSNEHPDNVYRVGAIPASVKLALMRRVTEIKHLE